MDVLILPLGSWGDVHPFVGLGRALHRRGHAVTVAANDAFEPLVLRAGLGFAAVGERADLEAALGSPAFWHPLGCYREVVQRLVLPAMRRQYEVIRERHRPGHTLIVASTMGLGARVAHDKLRLPLVSAHLQPMMIWSEFHSPVVGPLWLSERTPRILRRLQYRTAEYLTVRRWIQNPMNRFRAELDLPPLRGMSEVVNSPQRVIGLFPEWFAPRQPDWPECFEQTGFPLWDESEVTEPLPEVEAFLAAGEAPVVFTLSSTLWRPREFFAAAVGACRLLGCRGVLLAPSAEHLPDSLPDGVRHFPYVPFRHLLPRARAIVHHGGFGTGALALAAGLPQVVRPCSFDQPDNASRLRCLGVSETLEVADVGPERLARALERVLASPEIRQRSAECAARIEGSRALEWSADLVEATWDASATRV